MATFTQRMLGAAKFDLPIYEEVEADRAATGQAIGVVVLSSVAGGIGGGAGYGVRGIFVGVIAALVGWFLWAFVTYFIGTKLLPEPQTKADIGELLRTTGFAATPGVLRILGVIPFLRWLVGLAVAIWMLATFVVAVRQALDYRSTGRALGVCFIGWLIFVALSFLIRIVARV